MFDAIAQPSGSLLSVSGTPIASLYAAIPLAGLLIGLFAIEQLVNGIRKGFDHPEPPEEDPPWPQEAMSQKRQASLISIKDRRRRETFSVSQRKLLRESLIARKILDRKIAQARPRPLTMQTAGF